MNHLRLLRYVDEVARVGSIRQAAERLHVAPSAVNRRIQDIEDELGTPIFERLPRGMRLTAAGELFVRYIRGRAADLDRVRSEIEELQGLRRGSVRLVASQALAPRFLPGAIQAFRDTHPLVGFDVRIGDHVQAASALRSFETDLALVFNLAPEADIDRTSVVEQKLMAIMHAEHPLARTGAPALRMRDCSEYPVVLPNIRDPRLHVAAEFGHGSAGPTRPRSGDRIRMVRFDRIQIVAIDLGQGFRRYEMPYAVGQGVEKQRIDVPLRDLSEYRHRKSGASRRQDRFVQNSGLDPRLQLLYRWLQDPLAG